MIGDEFYSSTNQDSTESDQLSGEKRVKSNENCVTNINSDTFVNEQKSLTSKPTPARAITEVVNIQKSTCDLSETLAHYQAKFGPIPTILTGNNFSILIQVTKHVIKRY